jgi:hypothetical protein
MVNCNWKCKILKIAIWTRYYRPDYGPDYGPDYRLRCRPDYGFLHLQVEINNIFLIIIFF